MHRCSLVALLATLLAGVLLPTSVSAQAPTYITQWGTYGNGNGQFDRPVAVAVNSVGEVYVGDSRQPYVQRFAPGGQLIGHCATACPVSIALAVDRTTDKVFASDPSQYAVQVYTRDLVPIIGWNGAGYGGVGVAYGIAIGPAGGDLFIAGGAGHSVSRWTQNGALIQRWPDPGPGPSQLQSAWGIAVDAQGFVYVTDYAAHRVLKFTASGSYVTSLGSPSQFGPTTSVCVDGAGSVLVADPYSDQIEVFASDGTFLSAWGTSGQAPGQFSEPYGVAVFGTSVFVADAGNSRIEEFGGLPTPTRLTTWGRLKVLYR